MRKLNYLKTIEEILEFSPRLGENEARTARYICQFLRDNQINYAIQKFKTAIPITKSVLLELDGNKIDCRASSFVSGEIRDKSHLISSLTSSQNFIDQENINFNPKSRDFSLSNYYFAPSICVNRSQVQKIIQARKVFGKIEVDKFTYQSSNILVGNDTNPQNIIFTHYDSIGMGATDNASGVAVIIKTIVENRELLTNNLFVFCGNEELSYDMPLYWGHGYRIFENKYLPLMHKAHKIIVIDSVGNGPVQIAHQEGLLKLAFPVKNMKQLKRKTSVIYGDIDGLMEVYHSDADDIKQVNEKYLEESLQMLKNVMQR